MESTAITTTDVLEDPTGIGSQPVTLEFFEYCSEEMLNYFDYLEKRMNVYLLGERMILDGLYEQCKDMTNIEVVGFLSKWRIGIFDKYEKLAHEQAVVN